MQNIRVMYKQYTNGIPTQYFGGQEYLYKTDLPVVIGSHVLAPTKDDPEPTPATVTQVNLPESEINPAWASRVKAITQWDDDYERRTF